jgi:hypothetical protein
MDGKEPPYDSIRVEFIPLSVTFISDNPRSGIVCVNKRCGYIPVRFSNCLVERGDVFIVVDLAKRSVGAGEETNFVLWRVEAAAV